MFIDPINFRNNLTLDDWEYLRNYDGYGILLDLEWVVRASLYIFRTIYRILCTISSAQIWYLFVTLSRSWLPCQLISN